MDLCWQSKLNYVPYLNFTCFSTSALFQIRIQSRIPHWIYLLFHLYYPALCNSYSDFLCLSWPQFSLSSVFLWFMVVVQSLSHVRLFATPWTVARQAPLTSTVFWSLLKFMSTELVLLFTILSSASPFSSCLQSFPAWGSFPVTQLFPSGCQSLELQLQHQSFQWIFRVDFLWVWLVWSPWCPRGLWGVFSRTTIWKHQFFSA